MSLLDFDSLNNRLTNLNVTAIKTATLSSASKRLLPRDDAAIRYTQVSLNGAIYCISQFMSHSFKTRILIVEDEKEIADTLVYALTSDGFETNWVSNISDAHTAISNTQPSLGIFDVGLPDGNGFEFLKTLRQSGHELPVIFLTARSEEIDRIVGLEIGADDYVVKPFSPREVVARVKAILKRSLAGQNASDKTTREETERQSTSVAGKQTIFAHKAEQRSIYYQNTAIDLTRAEYELLLAFIAQPGRVFSRRQLIEKIWSNNHPSDDRAIDTHIKTLRAKLRSLNPHQDFIVTHRGFGYSLELPN